MNKQLIEYFLMPKKYKTQPSIDYEKLSCFLIEYDFPLLGQSYILCHEPRLDTDISADKLLQFAQVEAKRISLQHTNSSQNFILAISGSNIRKRSNWHIHIFIVKNRWQKAYAYQVLALKNFGLSLIQFAKS